MRLDFDPVGRTQRIFCDQRWMVPRFREPMSHRPVWISNLTKPFVAHFQKEGLASSRIRDIGALHDFVEFERLLAERA